MTEWEFKIKLKKDAKGNGITKRTTNNTPVNDKKYSRKRTVSFDLSKNQIQVLPSMKAIKNTIKKREEVNESNHSNFSTLSLTCRPNPLIPTPSCLPKSSSLKPLNAIF